MKRKTKTNCKLFLVGVMGLSSALLLQGCVVTPVAVAHYRPYCGYHRCYRHWHRWHREGCWVNRRGVMRCYG